MARFVHCPSERPKTGGPQREQRSQLSVSRTPSQTNAEGARQRKTELPGSVRLNASARIALSERQTGRKFSQGNGVVILKACRGRKLNGYGNEPDLRAIAGISCKQLKLQRQVVSSASDSSRSRPARSRQVFAISNRAASEFRSLIFKLTFLAGTLLLLNHIAQSVSSKSIEDSLSDSVNIDRTFLATLKPSLQLGNPTTSKSSENNLALIAETTTPAPKTSEEPSDQEQDGTSSQDDDNDAEGCQGISVGGAAEAKNYTDNERLVNLQACIQRKIQRRLNEGKRYGLEMFERLSLSGGCSSSIMSLVGSLSEIKAFAFKFLDATAKVPSGVMYGLLSDFGDFDQCLSIRSKPNVAPENEAEEGAFSGKYCLISVKLNYRAVLDANSTVPNGIIEDGVIWDELVRNYWTTKSPKGFQAGVCLPSRCTRDDLDQIYRYVADSYNVVGEIINCQDSLDLKNQYKPDFLQQFIIYTFYLLINLTLLGTILDRCNSNSRFLQNSNNRDNCLSSIKTNCVRLLLCFSIQRNWKTFVRTSNPNSNNWDCLVANSMGSSTDDDEPNDLNESASFHSQDSNERTDRSVVEAPSSNSTNENSSMGLCNQLTVKIQPIDCVDLKDDQVNRAHRNTDQINNRCSLKHLSGMRLLVIVWITIGHSFLYPSANNYQYYRSIINMNITRDSVWFATTNFTLGIDMLLYMTGLLFVYKLAHLSSSSMKSSHGTNLNSRARAYKAEEELAIKFEFKTSAITRLLLRKVLRFWPTYLTLIGIAILVPLLSDGPMWPEMVTKRLGNSCRRNWWSNLLFINNLLNESDICLPSSWFVAILMQLFLCGSLMVLLIRRISLKRALVILVLVLAATSGLSFGYAYYFNVRAPMIRMDESFVMELDEDIFRLYTTLFNNLGPFLVGIIGGLLMVHGELAQISRSTESLSHRNGLPRVTIKNLDISQLRLNLKKFFNALVVATIATLVLSSVFHQEYSRFWAAVYWSLHRIGWAIVTGYIINHCATGSCKLLNDILSISAFIPLNRLIPIAYLIYPIFIHVHSGLVRDGLHVSIYNMLNIYTTRLVLTFTTALIIHLLVELPFCSMMEPYINKWIWISENRTLEKEQTVSAKLHPLLAIAPVVSLDFACNTKILADKAVSTDDTKLETKN